MTTHSCRSCGVPLADTLFDLGSSPISNHYPEVPESDHASARYPLSVAVCRQCWLVQLDSEIDADAHFNESYAYFSSVSTSWLRHLDQYVTHALAKEWIRPDGQVCEVASNDGCLLDSFRRQGIERIQGIEPSESVASHAVQKLNVPTETMFLDPESASGWVKNHGHADLVVANNVLAHVPDPNGFATGLATILAPDGFLTIEFPHLHSTFANQQFDQIYHEHYCYLSLLSVKPMLERAGLTITGVEKLPTHGGSLRLICRHNGNASSVDESVLAQLADERSAGLDTVEFYNDAVTQIAAHREAIVGELQSLKASGKTVAGYTAPAKASTLCSYCEIDLGLVDFVCDKSVSKQGRYLPGTSIPVFAPDEIARRKPDVVIIFAWNIAPEVVEQLAEVRGWGGRFLVLIPRVAYV